MMNFGIGLLIGITIMMVGAIMDGMGRKKREKHVKHYVIVRGHFANGTEHRCITNDHTLYTDDDEALDELEKVRDNLLDNGYEKLSSSLDRTYGRAEDKYFKVSDKNHDTITYRIVVFRK